MKPLNLYKLKFACFLLLLVILPGCGGKTGTWMDGQISVGKRADFHEMNSQLLRDLRYNILDSLGFLLSKDLVEDGRTASLVEELGRYFQNNKYALLDEYYVVNKYPCFYTIKNGNHGINSYNLQFTDPTSEMYIAIFAPEKGDNKYLITACYNKFDYGWKLSSMQAGQYTINGKTTPELFNIAREQYAKGYLVNAVNTMDLADKCSTPNYLWEYPNAKEMNEFYTGIINSANEKYKFPFLLAAVPTHPRITRIVNEALNNFSYTKIYYLSSIDLQDTTALKRENRNIRKIIGNLIPGIDKDKKYLLYSVSNKMPTAIKEVDYYDMVDTLK